LQNEITFGLGEEWEANNAVALDQWVLVGKDPIEVPKHIKIPTTKVTIPDTSFVEVWRTSSGTTYTERDMARAQTRGQICQDLVGWELLKAPLQQSFQVPKHLRRFLNHNWLLWLTPILSFSPNAARSLQGLDFRDDAPAERELPGLYHK
jgi:hypothetical protein